MATQELQNIANAIEDIGYDGSMKVKIDLDTDTWNQYSYYMQEQNALLERIAEALEKQNKEEA
jgi:hypothetical protein